MKIIFYIAFVSYFGALSLPRLLVTLPSHPIHSSSESVSLFTEEFGFIVKKKFYITQ